MSRRGTGKVSVLTSITLDHAINRRKVLHVALGKSVSDVRAFRVSSEKIRDRTDNVPPELQITEFVTIGMMVIVNGRSEPGATLWIDNEKIDVFDDGRFYAVVRLRREGLNDLLFRAQDTAGNETRIERSAYVEVY